MISTTTNQADSPSSVRPLSAPKPPYDGAVTHTAANNRRRRLEDRLMRARVKLANAQMRVDALAAKLEALK